MGGRHHIPKPTGLIIDRQRSLLPQNRKLRVPKPPQSLDIISAKALECVPKMCDRTGCKRILRLGLKPDLSPLSSPLLAPFGGLICDPFLDPFPNPFFDLFWDLIWATHRRHGTRRSNHPETLVILRQPVKSQGPGPLR